MSGHAEESLREQVRAALEEAGVAQTLAALKLGVSTKHLCSMLTGRAPLTLQWAEAIVALCGMRVEVMILKGVRDQ